MGFGSYCNHKTCTVNQWPTTPTAITAVTTSISTTATTTTAAVAAAAAAAAASAALGNRYPLSVSPHRRWYANKNIYCGSNKHCVSYNNRDLATAVAVNQEQMLLLQLPLLFVVSSSSDAAAATPVNY